MHEVRHPESESPTREPDCGSSVDTPMLVWHQDTWRATHNNRLQITLRTIVPDELRANFDTLNQREGPGRRGRGPGYQAWEEAALPAARWLAEHGRGTAPCSANPRSCLQRSSRSSCNCRPRSLPQPTRGRRLNLEAAAALLALTTRAVHLYRR